MTMPLKQNKIFVFFLTVIFSVGISIFFLNQAKANIIIVNDPTGDDIDNGLCSIVEASINAQGGTGGSIDCTEGLFGDTNTISIETDIVLSTGFDPGGLLGGPFNYAVPNSGSVVINGNNHTIERDSGAPEFRIFSFSGGHDIEINDLTISGGDVTSALEDGGAIRTVSLLSLTLNNVTLDGNSAVDGGAIYIEYGLSPTILELNDSTLSNNTSSADGGAIYFDNSIGSSGSFIVSNSTFDSNTSTDNGGAVYAFDVADVQITESYFTGNNSSGGSDGGVFYLAGAMSVSVTDSYFNGNRPSTTRGAVFYATEDVAIEVGNSTFNNNVAGSGGVFYLNNGTELSVYNSSFLTSVAIDYGGVIFSYQDSGAAPNEIEFYYNTEEGSFAGQDGSSFMLNCIHDGSFCISNGGPGNETPFVGDFSYFENNIFLSDGCEGNMQNISFLNNLGEGNTIGCSETGANTPATNITNTLEEMGGLWKTFALNLGSNAIDNGVSGTLGCPATDGRGVPRPFGGECDIGAYEYTGAASISISESSGVTNISEPSTTDTYTISLGEGPSSSVTVNLTKSDNDFDVSPTSVIFTTTNWFTAQTVTVTAVNNSNDDGDRVRTVTHDVDSSDPEYSAIVPNTVTVNITDDDEATSSGGGGSSPPRVPPVPGCRDSIALNYNSLATTDNGSCQYEPIVFPGCDDLEALNYDIRVTENDGSCRYRVVIPDPILGCTDSGALNYDPSATTSNGSCTYPPVLVYGCIDTLATNFSPSADTDDGSCTYAPPPIIEEIPLIEEPADVTPIPSYPDNIPEVKEQTLRDVVNTMIEKISLVLGSILEVVSEQTLQYAAFAGVALPVVIFAVTEPVRLWSIIPTLLGIKRKKRPWGTVYDAVTKQPLDPVYLVLEDENGKEITTTISDLDGRFGFIASPGRYKIKARKDNYEFPSKRLLGKTQDELYDNLYFNEFIDIKDQDELLIKNIPMDPIGFNWNEFEKSKNKNLMKFFSKTDLLISKTSRFVFGLGVLISLVLAFASPSIFNFAILGVYYVLIFLKLVGIGPKKPGHVLEYESKNPLSFGIVKIFSPNVNKEIAHSVISKTGKYYALVPNGEYQVQISKKTGEDQYEHIFTSEILKVKNGYLGHIFRI